MSVTLDPIINTNTFGVWKDRTNDIIQALEDVVTIGGPTANAEGNITIRGDITSTANVIVDVIKPYTTVSPQVLIDAPLKNEGELTIGNGGDGAGKLTFLDDSTITWKIHTNADHSQLDIIKGTRYFRIDGNDGTITGSNVEIHGDILPSTNSIEEGSNNLYFTNTRARQAVSVAAGSSISYDNTTGVFDFTLPDIPEYGVQASKALSREADGINYNFGVNFDDETIKINSSNQLYANSAAIISMFSEGTGVDITETGTISIGQAVGTSSSVTFGGVTSGGNVDVKSGTNVTIRLTASDGSIVAEGDITAFGSASDARLKENVTTIESSLDKVSKLGGYTFNYIDKPDTRMAGVIAQEVQEVLPEVVYENEGHLAVRYGNMVPLLIEAIKELKAEIEELKKNK